MINSYRELVRHMIWVQRFADRIMPAIRSPCSIRKLFSLNAACSSLSVNGNFDLFHFAITEIFSDRIKRGVDRHPNSFQLRQHIQLLKFAIGARDIANRKGHECGRET